MEGIWGAASDNLDYGPERGVLEGGHLARKGAGSVEGGVWGCWAGVGYGGRAVRGSWGILGRVKCAAAAAIGDWALEVRSGAIGAAAGNGPGKVYCTVVVVRQGAWTSVESWLCRLTKARKWAV